jgi:hypothetical protein
VARDSPGGSSESIHVSTKEVHHEDQRTYNHAVLAVPLAVAAMTLLGMGMTRAFAQAPGMGAPPSKVEITIKDRQHGYETVGYHDAVA